VAFVSAIDERPGAMISASHNRWSDNGIKLFLPGGRKLTDELEADLEAELETPAGDGDGAEPGAPVRSVPDEVGRYRRHLVGTLEGRDLEGLRVMLDCSHGAASVLAPEVFGSLGAVVEVTCADPDGRNINHECGSTHPAALQQAVSAAGFDLGLAFDGDADRVLAVDETGRLVDGDQIIAMCAIDRRDRGLLAHETVVVTVMANLGFRRGMADTAIRVLETPVGDRYVLEALDEHGLTLGGEQSGHVIFRDLATTGDGLLTGLQLCDLLMRTGRFLSDLADAAMTRYPQVLQNVRVADRHPDIADRLQLEIAAEEAAMAGEGRILIRPSGTEPVVRVMVEARSAAEAEAVAERLVAAVERVGGR
jgi:phosphoglucosamine mutase